MASVEKSIKRRKAYGEGKIERRGTDTATGKPRLYAAFQVAKRRYHPRLEATNMEAARAELAQRIQCAREGRPFREPPKPAVAPPLTVRQLAEKFKAEAQRDVWNLDDYRAAFWSDYTCAVDPYIGTLAAVDVKRTNVATWRDKMKADGKSPRTILRGMRAASVMWGWALELGHLPDEAHNPVEGVKKPSYLPARELYTTDEVVGLLVEAAKKAPDLHPVIACAYFTGMRKGELAALRWEDVDFHAHAITVHRSFNRNARKSGKPVTVGLNTHLRDILGPLARADEELVFPDPRTGKMRPEHDAKHGCWALRELALMAKVKRLKNPWHGFRKAHATALEEAGATPSDIMRALGQSSIQVAMRYAEASPRRAAERVAMLAPLGPVRPDNVISFEAARVKKTA